MKLIDCYVNDFGKLSRLSLTFREGLTCFCLPNGEGKTTLAAFLKAMLYGMESYRETATGFCDRRKYFPFSGGRFGGTLRIEWRGEIYTLERTFDKKSESKDVLCVYDGLGRRTDALGLTPGEKIFGLDRATFARTAFIDAERVNFTLENGVRERLGDLVTGSPKAEISRAKERLDEERKRLRSDRKTAGRSTGVLPELEREIAVLEEELYALSEKRKEAARLIRERDGTEPPKKETEKKGDKKRLAFLLAFVFFVAVGACAVGVNLPLGLCSFGAALCFAVFSFFPLKRKGQGRVEEENAAAWRERIGRRAVLEEELRRLEKELAAEGEKRERLSSLEEERGRLETRRRLIGVARAALEKADENLRGGYLRPMEESFLKYARALDGELFSSVALSGEWEPYFVAGGVRRASEHYSDGGKTLLGLAMRLALLENVCTKEKPFLILDDPFVFLDERRFSRARAALCELAKEKQILYFCCHGSRKI